MAEPSVRILTSPIRTTGGLPRPHVAALTAADAIARWALAAGHEVEWVAGILAADLAGQYAVERDLAREGQDRASVGREEFCERARALEAADRERACELLSRLHIDSAHRTDSPLDDERVLRSARIAFVRLFEAGLLERSERVVATCPRCATVVDDVDAEAGVVDAELFTVRFASPTTPASVEVEIVEIELLPGVVAVLVPDDDAAVGTDVEVPLAGRVVPVLGSPDVKVGTALIPAHDAAALAVARDAGINPVHVLDGEGVVRQAGPLDGLGRYAARAAARELLTGDAVIVDERPTEEACGRCRRCGTIVVPRLGWHWFLPMSDLEVAAADAVREGEVAFSPPAGRDALLARAGQGGDWCLSHQVWSGYPVPAGRCLDCNSVVVAAELPASCGKCMGPVEGGEDVLDARFLGAVWPLAIAGWPDDESGPRAFASETTLVVGPTGVAKWALPMAALGVRVAAAVPFGRLSVHPDVDVAASAADGDIADLLAGDVASARLSLLSPDGDIETARALAAQFDDPADGEADVDAIIAAMDTAMAAGAPAAALAAAAAGLAEGVPAARAGDVRSAAAPLLGTGGTTP